MTTISSTRRIWYDTWKTHRQRQRDRAILLEDLTSIEIIRENNLLQGGQVVRQCSENTW